ncbi:MAG: DNA adenine methylase, partial [Methylacidiphilales bacterium]|nr:DNA adenine methylase [Candidatus Methylacidiphilales bacterium]
QQTAPYRTKPAVSWPGGKSRLLKHIMPLVPEHTCYCEPFAGGLAVLLAKERSQLEVLNDLNGDLVNFYRCVRFHADVLLTELEFVLNSREEFNDFRHQPGLTDIQRAARWFFRNKNCFGATDLNSFGTSALSGGASHGSRSSRMESIRALNLRLDRVCIEHLDWKRCVELYDRPSSFFFFDPPYTGCSATMYSAWTETDVLALKAVLLKLRGRWLVTLNDCPSIRAIFKGFKLKSVERARGINNKAETARYRELVISPA